MYNCCRQNDFGHMTKDKMIVYQITVEKMTVDKIAVNKMTVDKIIEAKNENR
jgi:hypothetical protein